ncbi:hypothetical protein [Lentzea sp. NPDC004782]|uniref:hypothetical protein n=1 Tax=Lentzea sp. NPDC004782 TaxID=3154458 RepID=UPI0033ACAFEA
MAELVELYSKGIKRKLQNYWPAWLPGTHFAIGDIGVLNGYLFEKVGSLRELGLKYYEEVDADSSSLDISSGSEVSVSFKAAGEVNPSFAHVGAAEVGLKVELGSTGAFVVHAPETFESEIGDRLNLRGQVIDAFRMGRWEKDWLVVIRLLKAPSATVLISRSSNSLLELSSRVDLSGVVAALGAADAGVTIKYKKGDTVNMIGGKNVTPLFQLARLKTSFFSEPKLETRSLRASDPSLADLTPSLVRADRELEQSLTFETLTDGELTRG